MCSIYSNFKVLQLDHNKSLEGSKFTANVQYRQRQQECGWGCPSCSYETYVVQFHQQTTDLRSKIKILFFTFFMFFLLFSCEKGKIKSKKKKNAEKTHSPQWQHKI